MANMGTITARLGLDDSRFKTGVNNVGKWGKAKFAAIGGAAAAAFAGAFAVGKFDQAVQRAASIEELSKQTGMATENFQRLDYAMRQSGGTTQDVVRGMNTLDRMMARANEGNEQAIKDFERLGITMDELGDMSRLEVIDKFYEAVNTMSEDQRGGILESLRRLLNDDAARKFLGAFQDGFKDNMAGAVVMSEEVLSNAKLITAEMQKLDDTILAEFATILSENSKEISNIIKFFGAAAGTTSKIARGAQDIGQAAFPIQKAIFEKMFNALVGIERNTRDISTENSVMGG